MTSKASSGEENELPKSVISRIAKRAVPASDNVLIASETKTALSKSTKMFILYLSACANDICHNEGKTRITAEHVLKAMDELELNFADTVKECFEAYKKDQIQKKGKKSSNTTNTESTTTTTTTTPSIATQQQQEQSSKDKDEMEIEEKESEEEQNEEDLQVDEDQTEE